MHYVYILQDLKKENSFYVGFTSDLKRRMKEHKSGVSGYTGRSEWKLVYYEAYLTDKAARDREASLKRNANMKHFLVRRLKKYL